MCAPEHDRTKTTARGKTLSAQIAYTRIPPGKSRAGIVIGGAAANATLPLNPGTFRAQHGQVSLRDPRATAATVGAELVPRIVEVADARALSTPPSIDSIGFELVTSPLPDACAPEVLGDAFAQQHDLAVAAYYSSLEETVKKLTRAHSATAFCHAVRSNKSATECRGAEAGYASYAHTDQSQDSWSSNAAALAQAGDMGVFPPGLSSQNVRRAIGGKRYAVLSAWRKLNHSQATHLAVLDHTTLRSEDVLPFHIIQDGCVGGNYRLVDSAEAACRHRWFYYPAMNPDEVLLFTAFDSAHPAAATLFAKQNMTASCLHAAFVDPTAPANEPARVSIDVRVLVVWDDDDAVNCN